MTTTMPLTIRFRAFWPGFDPHCFFIPFISDAVGREIRLQTRDDREVDLEVVSVFAERKRPGPFGTLYGRYQHRLPERWRVGAFDRPAEPSTLAAVSIWYSGENIRPPIAAWDATWSFDQDSLGGTNFYLPVWLIGMDFAWSADQGRPSESPNPASSDANFLGRRLHSEEMLRLRVGEAGDRSRFCCAFIGNPEAMRMRAIEALREIGDVDVYGRAVGRPVASKQSVAADYQFMLCFENDVYPGYVTEKPFEAWATGAIPLWRGWDSAGYLNAEALVNQLSCGSLDELVCRVEDLRRDRAAMNEVSSRPILTRALDLAPIRSHLRNLIRERIPC